MLKKAACIILTLVFVHLVSPHPSTAAGLGFYGTAGAGSSDWSVYDLGFGDTTFSKSTNHLGFGLALDTAPARDKLFNYQLNVGFDRFTLNNASAWGSADLEGFMVSNNFGFGTLISPTTRLWFGPELRVTWVDGAPRDYSDYHLRMFGFGFGPVIGLNLNFDNNQTVVLKTGYQVLNYVGAGEGHYDHTTNAASDYSQSKDYDITEKLFYVTAVFLIRTSDDRK